MDWQVQNGKLLHLRCCCLCRMRCSLLDLVGEVTPWEISRESGSRCARLCASWLSHGPASASQCLAVLCALPSNFLVQQVQADWLCSLRFALFTFS